MRCPHVSWFPLHRLLWQQPMREFTFQLPFRRIRTTSSGRVRKSSRPIRIGSCRCSNLGCVADQGQAALKSLVAQVADLCKIISQLVLFDEKEALGAHVNQPQVPKALHKHADPWPRRPHHFRQCGIAASSSLRRITQRAAKLGSTRFCESPARPFSAAFRHCRVSTKCVRRRVAGPHRPSPIRPVRCCQ